MPIIKSKLISLLFILLLLINLCSCSVLDKASNTFNSIKDNIANSDNQKDNKQLTNIQAKAVFTNSYTKFALDLFKNSVDKEENIIITPLSIYKSLLDNADEGNTKQIESLLGISIEDARAYLNNYLNEHPSVIDEGGLTNAGYNWNETFYHPHTYQGLFYCKNEDVKIVDMMYQKMYGSIEDGIAYKRLENGMSFLAIRLGEDVYDYVNDSLSPSTFNDLLASLTYSSYFNADDDGCSVNPNYTRISLPIFSYESDVDVSSYLNSQNINIANISMSNTIDISEKGAVVNKALEGTIEQESYKLGCDDSENDLGYRVEFDRPFIYVIMSGDIPLVIGYVSHLGPEEETNDPVAVNISGAINIRLSPYKDADKYKDTFDKGEKYLVSSVVKDSEYTWYKIGNDAWVADQGGKWIRLEYDE